MPDGILTPCNVARSRHWFRQVTAPGNVACGCGIVTGSRMTCHWIRPNVRYIGILHLVSISTTSPQSTSFCTSLRNFIQIWSPSAEKNDVMSIFKMADISHLGFYGSNNGFFEKPNYNLLNCLVFQKIAFLHFGVNIQDGRSPPSWILGV